MNGDHGADGARRALWSRLGVVLRNRFSRPPLLQLMMLVVALALGAAACTGPTAPVGTVPGSTASPTVTPSATPVPVPTRPAEKPTPDSAIAFVRYFWALYNYAYQTYDTKPLEAISDPECKYCSSTVDDVERIANAGTRVVGFDMEVLEAASPPAKITTGTLVVAAMRQKSGESIRSDGSRHSLKGFRQQRFIIAVAWSGKAWSVHGVNFARR